MTRKSKFATEEERLASIKASRKAYKERTKQEQSEYYKKYYAENKESMIRHNVEYARKKRSEKPKIEKPKIEKPKIEKPKIEKPKKEPKINKNEILERLKLILQNRESNSDNFVNDMISVAKNDREQVYILKIILDLVSKKL